MFKTRKVEQSRVGTVDFDHLSFGETFSDHMFRMDYTHGEWQEPEILPFGTIEVLPSLSTLHYGQSIFEGLKAFRSAKGGINVFRPEKHAERMYHSSDRLCIPRVDKKVFLDAIDALVTLDQKWVPNKKGTSLYIRPFTFATEDYIGVRVSEKYSFFIITGPVGAYYKEGFNPVSLMSHIRADKVLVCPVDLPLLTPKGIDAVVDASSRSRAGSFCVTVPAEVMNSLGMALTFSLEVEERRVVLCGVSVVDRAQMLTGRELEQDYMVTEAEEFALNVNTRADLDRAEAALRRRDGR